VLLLLLLVLLLVAFDWKVVELVSASQAVQ